MRCPKCDFDQDESAVECFKCGLVFSKYEALLKKKDQQNSRYSPQAGGEAAAAGLLPSPGLPVKPPAMEESSLAEAASREEILADEAAWRLGLAEKIERLHLTVQAASKFQEGLSRRIEAQQNAFGTLFEQFNSFRDGMDQQTLLLQTHLRMFSDQFQHLASGLTEEAPWASAQRDLAAVREQLSHLADESAETHPFHRLVSRLGLLENTQEQIRQLLSGPAHPVPSGGTDAEMPLLKSEVQALRAEVRGLLAPPAPSDRPQSAASIPETRLKQLDDRLQEMTQMFSGRLDAVQREKESQQGRLPKIEEAIRLLEDQLTGLASLAPGVDALSAELASLQQGYRQFVGGIQADLAQQQARLEQRSDDILRQQREIEETREIFARLRAVFIPDVT